MPCQSTLASVFPVEESRSIFLSRIFLLFPEDWQEDKIFARIFFVSPTRITNQPTRVRFLLLAE